MNRLVDATVVATFVCAALLIPTEPAVAQDAATPELKFPIARFQVTGNTLLSEKTVQQTLAPYVGEHADMADINKAIAALGDAYAKAGYPIVHIYPPQQTITDGVVVLRVVEGKVGAVGIAGNQNFSDANIRNSLPELKEGKSPNVKAVVAGVMLANENPAKQVAVNFQPGAGEGDVVARIDVTEDHAQKTVVNYDNYGAQATGYDIVSVAYQNANVFNRDQMLTAQFATTVQHPDDVKDFDFGYRIPFYAVGWSLDLVAAYSDSATNNSQSTAASIGPLQFTGKGTILAARLNESLPGLGAYRQKISYEIDYKNFNDQCAVDGVSTGSCGTVTAIPVILSYNGQGAWPGLQVGGSLSYVVNLPGGANGSLADYSAARFGATRNWQAWRLSGFVDKALPGDWQIHAMLNGQQSYNALIPTEQFGIGGATSVRGYGERALAGDAGYSATLELYTPELGAHLGTRFGPASKLRLLLFVDYGSVRDKVITGAFGPSSAATLGSAGLGLRYTYGKSWDLKLDVGLAQHASIDSSWNTTVVKLNDQPGRWLGPVQLSMSYTF